MKRFIYASSSSVYGIKDEEDVTEDLPLQPLTDYSKYKAMCEEVLEREREPGFTTLTLRPATVCGYSPRLRLDLSVNILTNLAYHKPRDHRLRRRAAAAEPAHPGHDRPLRAVRSDGPPRGSTGRSTTPAGRT